MPTGLNAWIQAQHLTESALLQFRNSFQRHPVRLLILKDFLQEAIALRLSDFLEKEAKFEVAHGLYSAEHQATDEEAWLRVDESDRFFRFSKLLGVSPAILSAPTLLPTCVSGNLFRVTR